MIELFSFIFSDERWSWVDRGVAGEWDAECDDNDGSIYFIIIMFTAFQKSFMDFFLRFFFSMS